MREGERQLPTDNGCSNTELKFSRHKQEQFQFPSDTLVKQKCVTSFIETINIIGKQLDYR